MAKSKPQGDPGKDSDVVMGELAEDDVAIDATSSAPDPPAAEPAETQPETGGPWGSDNGELVAERDHLLGQLQRLQADFENYRKRVARDQEQAAGRGAAFVLEQLLPVLDAFDNAMAMDPAADAEGFQNGVRLVQKSLANVLTQAGLERIDTVDVDFDPVVHEAVVSLGGEGDPTVVEVLRSGYAIKGRVVRPAMVKVSG